MRVLLGSYYNVYTAALNTTAKTLTISNVIGFDLTDISLQSIYSSTATAYLPIANNIASVTVATVAGLPVWTYTFKAIPGGIGNSDTLVILLEIPDSQAVYSVQSYIASKA